MLTGLIDKFKNANGRSEFVIAIVCDIRGFSAFCKNHEAPDIAMFSKRFYVRLLEEYFVDTDFAKPTGDGLLLLFRYSEHNLHEIADSVLNSCLSVVRDFPTMMNNDVMINYEVPDSVGFGIARGAAFCLYSDNEVVDYSGQTLNLASRLNEFARPHGVVIDGSFMKSVIPEGIRDSFYADMVYVRGISEELPREVFCSNDVLIPPEAKASWKKSTFRSVDHSVTVGFAKKMPDYITIKLPEEPSISVPCSARVQWVHSTASWLQPKAPEYTQWRELIYANVEHTADGYFVRLRTEEITRIVEEEKLAAKAQLSIRIQYVPALPGNPAFTMSGG
jgi:class 3 adenylate cyclase